VNPIYGESLYHYGIQGQKWGVKRYQNADRTWTDAGKERYGRKGTLAKARSEKKSIKGKKSAKSEGHESKIAKNGNPFETYQKRQIKKKFDISDETLNKTKVKDLDLTKYRPKHEINDKSEAVKFIANLAMDTLVPGYQVYLPMDIYRGGKALASHVKSKKYDKERESNPVDKKTGFHLKTQNLSEKEDLKRVNPDFNDFNSNSKSNCVLCTMTCEMRRRGYDVTANKAGMGYFDREIKKMFKNYKVEHIDTMKSRESWADKDYDPGANPYSGGGKIYAQRVIEKIEKSQPEGSRGNLSVNWGGKYGGGGHSMFYEIKNGKMVVYDGQSGKIYSNPEKILKNCTSVDIGRLDNLKFDNKGIKECCK